MGRSRPQRGRGLGLDDVSWQARIQPDWDSAAEQQIDVREDEGALVSCIEERREKGRERLGERRHVRDTHQLEDEEDGFFDGDDAEESANDAHWLADDDGDDDGDGKAAESANSTATTTATTKPSKGAASASGGSMVPPA